MQANVPDRGRGPHNLPESEATEKKRSPEERLYAVLVKTFQSPKYEPPVLPAVAVRLLKISSNPNVATREIAELLESDPLLLARVLRQAQSAIFGSHPVRSTTEALIRLGRKKVMDIVMLAAMNMTVFNDERFGDQMEAIRRHSILTGHICEMVARFVGGAGGFPFLSGLLHDVGAAGCLLIVREANPDVSNRVLGTVLKRAHERASALLVALWGLPDELEATVGAHHGVLVNGHPDRAAAVVCLAEYLASQNDVSWLLPAADRTPAEALRLARKTLRIDGDQWSAMVHEAERIHDDVVATF